MGKFFLSLRKMFLLAMFLMVILGIMPRAEAAMKVAGFIQNPNLNFILSEQHVDENTLVANLSKFQVLIVDAENVYNAPRILQRIQQANPGQKLFLYWNPMELWMPSQTSVLAARPLQTCLLNWVNASYPAWYVQYQGGGKASYWTNMDLMNMSSQCPVVGGFQWSTYLPSFLVENLKKISSPRIDGLFLDNIWDNIAWTQQPDFMGKKILINGSTMGDGQLDSVWRQGIYTMLATFKQLAPHWLLIGNKGNHREYESYLSGKFFEDWPTTPYSEDNNVVNYINNGLPYNIINTTISQYQQAIDFNLASAALGDGYSLISDATVGHNRYQYVSQYYDRDLGSPTGKAYKTGQGWRRDYTKGYVLVNMTNRSAQIVVSK